MEEKEVRYGFGTRIDDENDWKNFVGLFNAASMALGYEGEDGPLSDKITVSDLPAMVAVETFTRSELEEAVKMNPENKIDLKAISAMLNIVDEGYPVCVFRMD